MKTEHEFQDLFTTPELIPAEVQAVFDTAEDNTYSECERILKEVEQLGYTFDFYLTAEPFNLTRITSFDNVKQRAKSKFGVDLNDKHCEAIINAIQTQQPENVQITNSDIDDHTELYLTLIIS